MVVWAEFRFPAINLWSMPLRKDLHDLIMERMMSGGIESMFEDEYSFHSKQLNLDLLDTEIKEWETSTKLVIKDMKKREAFGLQKYGKSLNVGTDEDMLQHLYEELMDGAVYIRTLIEQ